MTDTAASRTSTSSTTAHTSAVELRMPALGADMTEGRIVEWLVEPGDSVERGEIVAVVETDKADIEIEVFQAATIGRFLVEPGEVVPVGTPIAELRAAAPAGRPEEPPADADAEQPPADADEATQPQPADDATADQDSPAPHAMHVTSPLVRHLAEQRQVDIAHLHGTGPGGRVTRSDVERAASASAPASTPAPAPGGRARVTPRARRLAETAGISAERLAETVAHGVAHGRPVTGADVLDAGADEPGPPPPDPMRRRIAELMARSWPEIPHYHLERRLDVGGLLDRLRTLNEQRSVADRVLPAAVLLAGVAAAARRVPECNGWWRDDRFHAADHVDIGVVLSLRSGGVIVPTIANADELDVDAMMGRLREVVERARRGRLRGSDLAEASITVTNLGDQGADAVFGVIHPPQVALVGLGAVRDDVWADGDSVRVARTVRASLSGDHRATDGLTGSVFLAEMNRALDRLLREETP